MDPNARPKMILTAVFIWWGIDETSYKNVTG
jgi:hypothetical protein